MSVPRDKTLEAPVHPLRCERCRQGKHMGANGECSYYGSTNRYPARQVRRRVIGGKRGRNSGAVKSSKNKS